MGSRLATCRVLAMGLSFLLAVVVWRAVRPSSTRDEGAALPDTPAAQGTGFAIPEDVLAVPAGMPGMGASMEGGYWYMPYAIVNEKQGIAMVDALTVELLKGKPFPRELAVPEGKGAGGRDLLYPIQPGVERMFMGDINTPVEGAVSETQIPVIISQPKPGDVSADVLYMDGHLESVRVGKFPLTSGFIAALSKLDPPDYLKKGGHAH